MKSLFVAALLLTTPAAAQSSVCWPLDLMTEKAQTKHLTVRPLSDEGTKTAIGLYNRTPPLLNPAYDYAVAMEAENGAALIWFGTAHDQFLCTFMAVSPQDWAKLRMAFLGRAA